MPTPHPTARPIQHLSRRIPALITSILLAAPSYTHADTVSWNVDTAGAWETPANWTSNPNLPGPNDDVVIDRPSGSYPVTLTLSQSVHSLFSNEPLTAMGTLTTATTLKANGGMFIAYGPTFIGGTLTGSASFAPNFGTATFDGLTLGTSILMQYAHLNIRNNLVLANAELGNSFYPGLRPSGTITLAGTQSISGHGTITLAAYGADAYLVGGIITINPGVTLLTKGASNVARVQADTIINNGIVNLGSFGNVIPTLVNNGTLTTGDSFRYSDITNLTGSGGHISGIVTVANTTTAALNLPGISGTVHINGTLDNTGSLLALGPASPLYFEDPNIGVPRGTLKGGTVTVTGGKLLTAAILDGLTIGSGFPSFGFAIKNGLTLNNALVSIAFANFDPPFARVLPILTAAGPQTISGTGTISFDVTTGAGQFNADSLLTLSPGITLIPNKQDVSLQVPTFINQGQISLPTARTLFVNTANGFPSTSFTSTGTISGPGNITFNASTSSISGTFNVTGTTTLGPGALVTFTPGAYHLNNLLISANSSNAYTAKLDLTTSTLIFQTNSDSDKQSKLSQLKSAIASGSANTFTGNGITSSTAHQDPAHYTVLLLDNAAANLPSIDTQLLDSSNLIVTLAHFGDANLNGVIDIQDLTLVANNWQKPSTTWAQGDLNLDGLTDLQDFTLVANNWQQTSPLSLSSSVPQSLSAFPQTPVPEPASALLLLTSPALLLLRRPKPLRHDP